MSQVYVEWSHAVAEIEYAAARRDQRTVVIMDPALSVGRMMEILHEIAPGRTIQIAPVPHMADSGQLRAV